MASIDEVLTENQRALAEFLAAAGAIDRTRWHEPRAPGKWTPAQMTEHIALTYENGRKSVRGEHVARGMPRIIRPLIRRFILSRILKTGRFPRGRAVGAFVPSDNPPPADVLFGRVRQAAAAYEQTVRDVSASGTTAIDHFVFGRTPLVDYVRVLALHTRHHMAQLPQGTVV
jgi:hypothetical protein